MDTLIKYLIEGFKESKKVNIFIIIFGFLLAILLFGISFYLRENSEYASALLNGSMFLFGISFILFLLYLSYEGKKQINIKEIGNIVNVLKDLQERFKKIDFFEACDINEEIKFWKDIFKIKNNTKITIVCAIDEETGNIHNFYIRSSIKEIRDKILNYKNVDKNYNKKLGYNFTNLVYKETEEMCKDGKYEEAIEFLIDILKKAEVIKK